VIITSPNAGLLIQGTHKIYLYSYAHVDHSGCHLPSPTVLFHLVCDHITLYQLGLVSPRARKGSHGYISAITPRICIIKMHISPSPPFRRGFTDSGVPNSLTTTG
ncbi:hypothetical protein PILCRDRAFT_815312, partial [Piloderma croceum F 1598]